MTSVVIFQKSPAEGLQTECCGDPDSQESASFRELNPDPHQSENVEACYFRALEGSNLEKSEW
jgi:hypothetical protein